MAVNSQQLLEKAQRCRELAETAMTDEGREILREMAFKYELEATAVDELRASPSPAEAVSA